MNEIGEKKDVEEEIKGTLLVKSSSINVIKYKLKISWKIKKKNLIVIFWYFIKNKRLIFYSYEKYYS